MPYYLPKLSCKKAIFSVIDCSIDPAKLGNPEAQSLCLYEFQELSTSTIDRREDQNILHKPATLKKLYTQLVGDNAYINHDGFSVSTGLTEHPINKDTLVFLPDNFFERDPRYHATSDEYPKRNTRAKEIAVIEPPLLYHKIHQKLLIQATLPQACADFVILHWHTFFTAYNGQVLTTLYNRTATKDFVIKVPGGASGKQNHFLLNIASAQELINAVRKIFRQQVNHFWVIVETCINLKQPEQQPHIRRLGHVAFYDNNNNLTDSKTIELYIEYIQAQDNIYNSHHDTQLLDLIAKYKFTYKNRVICKTENLGTDENQLTLEQLNEINQQFTTLFIALGQVDSDDFFEHPGLFQQHFASPREIQVLKHAQPHTYHHQYDHNRLKTVTHFS